MAALFDIKLLGDKRLERALAQLPGVSQKKVIRKETRDSAKRLQPKVAAALPRDSGELAETMAKTKIRSAAGGKRGVIRVGFLRPASRRQAIKLIISEYGSQARGQVPGRHVRRTVDAEAAREHGIMGRGIGVGIEREWARLAKGPKY